jgi:hypothetical protein
MASRRDQENWQEDRLMIFLTAAATKGAQRNKGPDHGIQVVDPPPSPSPPYWLWPVLKSAANYLLTHFEKRHLLVLVANIFFCDRDRQTRK